MFVNKPTIDKPFLEDGAAEVQVVDAKNDRVYRKGRLLGKGGFAMCYLFQEIATGHFCAAKCVEKNSLKKDRARTKLLSEIKIHRALCHKGMHHKNIVAFERFFEDKTHVYILLEYCQNQTLMELVKRNKRLSEDEASNFAIQIVNGVEYLHSVNVIHRDLKLGNIFLTNGNEVRIGDFGLATKLEHENEMKKTICGTPNYIAPEILDGKLGHSFAVDIWSIGVIVYTMIVGRPPFETKDVKQTYKRIQENIYSFPTKLDISDNAKSFIRGMLKTNPSNRPNIKSIKHDPFFDNLLQSSTEMYSPRSLDKENACTENLGNMKLSNCPNNQANEEQCQLSVEKWVDYTSKYGLGYILKDGIVGVYFNDSTKLVIAPDRINFQYHERGAITYESHSFLEYPESLKKKVTLAKHFRTYLETPSTNTISLEEYDPQHELPFVKKWVRTRHAIFFRLSNRTVQVAFFDDTQLVLSAHTKMLTFYDKLKQSQTISISDAKAHPDIVKRLKYTREVLQQIISPVGTPTSDKNNKKLLSK